MEQAWPFDQLIPNEETIEAMKEASRGGLPSFESVEALMVSLNVEDGEPNPPLANQAPVPGLK